MFYSQDRHKLRQFFYDAWRKFRADEAMEPMERMVAQVVAEHPEYHALLEHSDPALDQDYRPELGQTNPFLHLGMHIAIHEQLTTDRPVGIRDIHQTLAAKLGDSHEAEHRMQECLGEMIWHAQRANTEPDEEVYLECLRKML